MSQRRRARFLLTLLIACIASTVVGSRGVGVAHGSSSSSSSSTPFGPFSFSGSFDSSWSIQTFTLTEKVKHQHEVDETPLEVPFLIGDGLKVEFQPMKHATGGRCSFSICVTNLVLPISDPREWRIGSSKDTTRSDICEIYFNITHGEDQTVTKSGVVSPGIKHIGVFARHHKDKVSKHDDEEEEHTTMCPFEFTLSGDACTDGLLGADCDERPYSIAADSAVQSFDGTLTADRHARLYLEFHPTSVYSSAITINATSNRDNFTLFIHEGSLPSFDAPLHATDLNQSSTSFGSGSMSLATINTPSYRVVDHNRRYFVGVTRVGPQRDDPHESKLSISVTERSCPPGYHGINCEYFVEFLMEPFQLATTGRNIVYRTSFQWSMDHTQIWHYFALIFLSIRTPQNFTVGIRSLEGQEVPGLYLRLGGVPTLTQYDMRSIAPSNGVRFFDSGPTLLHDAIWYVGLNIPTSYQAIGDVALWINTPCPGTESRLRADGRTTVVTVCSGHGRCDEQRHECVCDHSYAGYRCESIDTTLGLSGTTRAIIAVCLLVLIFLFGYFWLWWFRTGRYHRPSNPMARAGHGYRFNQPPEQHDDRPGQPPPGYRPRGIGRI